MDFEECAVKAGLKIDKYAYGEYQFHKTQVAYDAFKAGQQSKQAEIDALKAKINEAMELLEYNEYTDSHLQALDVLKGESK